MFGKFLNKAKKVQNVQLLEAIIAGSMLVAAADGSIDKSETEKLTKLLKNNENLSAFKEPEIRQLVSKYQGILEADFAVGKFKMKKELADISHNSDQSEEVFLNMIAIAKSDGDVGEDEMKVLVEVASTLSLSVQDFGLAV